MTSPVALDLDRLALIIGHGVLENLSLKQQLEAAQEALAAQPPGPGERTAADYKSTPPPI